MEEENKLDLLLALSHLDLEHLIFDILSQLSALDLRCCQLVSSSWSYLVECLFQRHEKKFLGQGCEIIVAFLQNKYHQKLL